MGGTVPGACAHDLRALGTVVVVVLLVIAVGGGLVAGLLRRPTGGHSARPHLRLPLLLAGAVVFGVASGPLGGDLAVLAYCFALAMAAWFVGVNRHVTGLLVAGVGIVANLLGLVLNNGVPVRAEALLDADVVEVGQVDDHEIDAPRHLETDADSFAWLGALVPVPIAHEVVSFGDLIVLVGLADATRELARRRARLPQVEDEDDGYWAAIADASDDQDWGLAPSGAPVSGSQYSAYPEARTPDTVDFWRESEVDRSPLRIAARHTK
jgi:hypothetical protein